MDLKIIKSDNLLILNNNLIELTLNYLTYAELIQLKKLLNRKLFKVSKLSLDKKYKTLNFQLDKIIKITNNDSSIFFLEYLNGFTQYSYNHSFSDIIAVAAKSNIYLVSVSSGETLRIIQTHSDDVECLLYLDEYKLLLSGSKDRTISKFSLCQDSIDTIYTLSDSAKILVYLKNFNYESDNQNDYVACGTGKLDKSIQIWKILSNKRIKCLRGHEGSITCLCQLPDKLNELLASGSLDKTLRIWNVAKGECIYVHDNKSSVLSMTVDPFKNYIICGSGKKSFSINVFNKEINLIKTIVGHTKGIWGIYNYRDYNINYLLSGGKDKNICIWDNNFNNILNENINFCVNFCLAFKDISNMYYYSIFAGEENLFIYGLK